MEDELLAIPDHLTGGGGHGLQSFNGGLRLALLDYAQHGVQQHNDYNNAYFHQTLSQMAKIPGLGKLHKVKNGGSGRHHSRDHQNDQHGVFQLLHKSLEPGGLFPLFQLVGAILFKPALRFLAAQAIFIHAKVLQHLFGGLGVGFSHQINTPL